MLLFGQSHCHCHGLNQGPWDFLLFILFPCHITNSPVISDPGSPTLSRCLTCFFFLWPSPHLQPSSSFWFKSVSSLSQNNLTRMKPVYSESFAGVEISRPFRGMSNSPPIHGDYRIWPSILRCPSMIISVCQLQFLFCPAQQLILASFQSNDCHHLSITLVSTDLS